MDYATFARTARALTRQSSSTFTDIVMVDFVNLAKGLMEGDIVNADEGNLEMTAYTNLVANQRVYELPSDLVNRIVKVEIKLDGTNWKKMYEIDFNTVKYPISSESDITSNASDNPITYSLYRGSIYLWSASSITTVSQGLRLYYSISPHTWTTSDLSSIVDIAIDPTTTDVGLPGEFHPVLLYMVTRMFKLSRDIPIELTTEEQSVESMFAQALNSYRNANRDRIMTGELPVDYGYNY